MHFQSHASQAVVFGIIGSMGTAVMCQPQSHAMYQSHIAGDNGIPKTYLLLTPSI